MDWIQTNYIRIVGIVSFTISLFFIAYGPYYGLGKSEFMFFTWMCMSIFVTLTGININSPHLRLDKEASIKSSGKKGEKIVKSILKKLRNQNFRVFNNKCLKSEGDSHEIDHIIFADRVIFNLETKNYSGEININENGAWSRKKPNGEINTNNYENPLSQIKGHHDLLQKIFGNKYNIVDILVIANPTTEISGKENYAIAILKSNELLEYIKSYGCYRQLTQEEITYIESQISAHTDIYKSLKTKIFINNWLSGSLALLLVTAIFFSTSQILTKSYDLKDMNHSSVFAGSAKSSNINSYALFNNKVLITADKIKANYVGTFITLVVDNKYTKSININTYDMKLVDDENQAYMCDYSKNKSNGSVGGSFELLPLSRATLEIKFSKLSPKVAPKKLYGTLFVDGAGSKTFEINILYKK